MVRRRIAKNFLKKEDFIKKRENPVSSRISRFESWSGRLLKMIDVHCHLEQKDYDKDKLSNREEYTYGTKISFEDDAKINKIKADCKEIIDKTKGMDNIGYLQLFTKDDIGNIAMGELRKSLK